MSQGVFKKAVLLLAIIYLCSATFSEVGHIHLLVGSSPSTHQLTSQNTGSHERHIPIGDENNCPICQQVHQFVSTLTVLSPAVVEESQQFISSIHLSFHSQETISYFFERGPPSILS